MTAATDEQKRGQRSGLLTGGEAEVDLILPSWRDTPYQRRSNE